MVYLFARHFFAEPLYGTLGVAVAVAVGQTGERAVAVEVCHVAAPTVDTDGLEFGTVAFGGEYVVAFLDAVEDFLIEQREVPE